MKENFKLGSILLVITLVAGVLLGVTNELTKEQILMNSRVSSDDLEAIMPEANGIKEIAGIEATEEVSEIYEAVNGSNTIGYVLKVTVKGFKEGIDFVVGISNDEVSGIKVLSHKETPGLGARIEEEEFTAKYAGKSLDEELETVMGGASADNQIEGISGATISSKATTTAVNTAVKFYREKVKGETVTSKPKEEHNLDLADERLVNLIEGTELVEEVTEVASNEIVKYYVAKQGDAVIGHVLMVEEAGFNDDIIMLVGINSEDKITGIEVLAQDETENLGALIIEDEYKGQFVGKSIEQELVVVQSAPSGDADVQAVSGATVSSEASVKAINKAIKYYLENLKG